MSSVADRTEPVSSPTTGYGGQSMIAPLKRVIVRRPTIPASGEEWRALGYLHQIDQVRTEEEHFAFRSLIAAHGVEVIEAGPDAPGDLDAIFPFDPSIMTDAGSLLLRPGKKLRRREVGFAEETYTRLGIPILGRIEAPGTVEGGDTMWLDEHTLAVGRGYRTNAEGIRQLSEILGGIGVTVLAFDLPHFNGPAECLHLLSLISPVAEKLAVVYPPLMAVSFIETLRAYGWNLVDIAEDEFATQASNVLAIAPGQLIMLDGNPITRRRLEFWGCEVETYAGEEISLNRFGGPTCLTRPILRAG
jgi:N-dimethylarginine dimethylaminohydrolase